MNSDFTRSMSVATDAELIKILTVDREHYQEAAVHAAEVELTKRDISTEQIERTIELHTAQKQFNDIKANAPLDTHWKVLTFMFPAILQMIISGVFKSEGYDRKANELAKWTLYGFCFYVSIVILLTML